MATKTTPQRTHHCQQKHQQRRNASCQYLQKTGTTPQQEYMIPQKEGKKNKRLINNNIKRRRHQDKNKTATTPPKHQSYTWDIGINNKTKGQQCQDNEYNNRDDKFKPVGKNHHREHIIIINYNNKDALHCVNHK